MTALVRAAGRLAASIGHRALNRLGGGALEARLAVWAAAATSLAGAARAGAHPVDLRHHGGGMDLHHCRACGYVSVVTIGLAVCHRCGSTPPAAGLAAGVRPGAVSDGSLATAPAPGHLTSVPSIAAIIEHHQPSKPGLVRLDETGMYGMGDIHCLGTGCKWTGRPGDHAVHVAGLIDAMIAADNRIAFYLNGIRRT